MSMSKRYPGYMDCVAQVLSDARQPLGVDQMLEKIEEMRPVGRSGRGAVIGALARLFQAVPVDDGLYGWLPYLLAGTTYRHILGHEEVRRGYLLLDEMEHTVFDPQFFQQRDVYDWTVSVELLNGPVLSGELRLRRAAWSLTIGRPFAEWLDICGADARDHLIIQVIDATERRYALRVQPYEVRNPRVISMRNRELAALAESVVDQDRRTAMPTWELAASLIGRGMFQSSTPPDDLHTVLHKYSILHFLDENGYSVQMPDAESEHAVAMNPADLFAGHDPYVDDSADLDDLLEMVEDDMLWDVLDDDLPAWEEGQDDDMCVTYEMYLANLDVDERQNPPLSHEEFHLLEAELEMLVALELEFGTLLPEQKERKESLGGKLFIDPDSMLDNGSDSADFPGFEDPPY